MFMRCGKTLSGFMFLGAGFPGCATQPWALEFNAFDVGWCMRVTERVPPVYLAMDFGAQRLRRRLLYTGKRTRTSGLDCNGQVKCEDPAAPVPIHQFQIALMLFQNPVGEREPEAHAPRFRAVKGLKDERCVSLTDTRTRIGDD